MRVTKVMNFSLLKIIREHKEISLDKLKEIYILPMPKGVISSRNACFNDDLKILESEGKIKIEGEIIKYISM